MYLIEIEQFLAKKEEEEEFFKVHTVHVDRICLIANTLDFLDKGYHGVGQLNAMS